MSPAPLHVVGIGADGLDGLAPTSRAVLAAASSIHGSPRQLALVEALGVPLRPWPSPLLPALGALAEEIADSGGVVLASGDPMFHGIGSTLARVLGPERLQVYPAPSSVSLAAARTGWPLADLTVHSCVTADPHTVLSTAAPGARALVLCRDRTTPVELARVLSEVGAGASTITVLADLGAATETRHTGRASDLTGFDPGWSDLCIAAVEVALAVERVDDGPVHRLHGTTAPGLPDHAYDSDGQLTKRHVRALAVSALAPAPGELLWDVGGGSGSIAVEWMRAARGARAVCVERDGARIDRIRRNAAALGVPGLRVVHGEAPEALSGLDGPPDAVFIGGGLTSDGLIDACWSALRPGGRLVAAAVTLESEAVLVDWRRRHGGILTRITVESAEPLGTFSGWRPARPVVHLDSVKHGGSS